MESGSTGAPKQEQGASLLVHGGAWDIPEAHHAEHLQGLRQALGRGRALLLAGTPALEVVAEAVAVLESHGAFDAGRGAVLNRDGAVELDAGLMCGDTLRYGAAVGIQHLENPIRLAHRILLQEEGQVRILAGAGAERFAAAQGFTFIDNEALICAREQERFEALQREAEQYHTSHSFLSEAQRAPQGTVGCVARDRQGHLAAATSTGGTPFRHPGRIGDSPLPGAGYYANEYAAASATGWGEAIIAALLTGRAVDQVAAGATPEAAARARLSMMQSHIQNRDGQGATGGLIVLGQNGQGGWAFTTPRMARGGWHEGGEAWVEI